MESENHCLICHAPGLHIQLPKLSTGENGPSCRSDPYFFLLQEVLYIPAETCQRIFETTGAKPEDWFSLCFPCSEAVLRAFHLQQWIIQLPAEMERVRGALRGKLVKGQEQGKKKAAMGGRAVQLLIRQAVKRLSSGHTVGPKELPEVTRLTKASSPRISTTVLDVSASVNSGGGDGTGILQTTLEQHETTRSGDKRKRRSTTNLSDHEIVSSTGPVDEDQPAMSRDEEAKGGKRRRVSERLSQKSRLEKCESGVPISSYHADMGHKQDHEDSDCVTRFSCEYCKFVGKDLGMLRKHLQDFHKIRSITSSNQAQTEKKFVCDKTECDYVTNTARNLGRHMKTHNITDKFEPVSGSNWFRCKLCGVENGKLQMYKHIREYHTVETSTASGLTGATALGPSLQQLPSLPDQPSSSSAASSKSQASKGRINSVTCKLCGLSFYSKGTLKAHVTACKKRAIAEIDDDDIFK